MADSFQEVLRDQGRGIIGALLLGTPLLMTMETRWRAEHLPWTTILAFAAGGLVAIMAAVRFAGFRKARKGTVGPMDLASEFAELVLQSLVAAAVILFLFGVVGPDDSPATVARLLLIQLPPLGLGAALASAVLEEARGGEAERSGFWKGIAIFAVGATFFALHIAPTAEMGRLPAAAGWWRLGGIVVVSVLLTYLSLYELQFRGHERRTSGRSKVEHVGEAFTVYLVALTVSTLLLAGYGQFAGEPFSIAVSKVIVLGFAATLGGSVGQVGLG